jgi:hypothetical protein
MRCVGQADISCRMPEICAVAIASCPIANAIPRTMARSFRIAAQDGETAFFAVGIFKRMNAFVIQGFRSGNILAMCFSADGLAV